MDVLILNFNIIKFQKFVNKVFCIIIIIIIIVVVIVVVIFIIIIIMKLSQYWYRNWEHWRSYLLKFYYFNGTFSIFYYPFQNNCK